MEVAPLFDRPLHRFAAHEGEEIRDEGVVVRRGQAMAAALVTLSSALKTIFAIRGAAIAMIGSS
jgi:hypothetical protein